MTRFEFLMKVEQYKNGEITEMDMVAAAEAWEKALIAAKPIVSRRSSEDDIKAMLIQMLGRNAFNNGFEVDEDVAGLCKTVRYLVTQIGFAAQMEPDDAKEHVDKVLLSSVDLLSKNGG